jgi:DNA-binding protein H-NS
MDELEKLQNQIIELQNKADTLQHERKATVIKEVQGKIKAYNLTAKDLGLGGKGKSSSPVAVKYRKGDQTWTGRGRQPKFVVDHLAKGGKIEDLLV